MAIVPDETVMSLPPKISAAGCSNQEPFVFLFPGLRLIEPDHWTSPFAVHPAPTKITSAALLFVSPVPATIGRNLLFVRGFSGNSFASQEFGVRWARSQSRSLQI